MQLQYNYTTLHYTTLHHTNYMTYYNYNYNYDYRDIALHYTTLMKLHELHYSTTTTALLYTTLQYTTLHYNYNYANYTTPQLQLQLQLHYTNYTTLQLQLHYTTPQLQLQLRYTKLHPAVVVRWPLQPLQLLQKPQLQPPFSPSVDLLCHPWFATTNLSYRSPIFETSAAALCSTTGNIDHFGRDGFLVTNGEVRNSRFIQCPFLNWERSTQVSTTSPMSGWWSFGRDATGQIETLLLLFCPMDSQGPHTYPKSVCFPWQTWISRSIFCFQSISNVFQLFLEQSNSFFSLPHIFPTVFFRSWSWARTYGRRRTAMTRLCHRCIPTPRWSAPRSTSPQSRQAGRSPMR